MRRLSQAAPSDPNEGRGFGLLNGCSRTTRHTHATHLLKAGVHPKVVQERLDHAFIGITLNTYSHVMPGMQEEAAEKIDAGLRAALGGYGRGLAGRS